MTVYSFAEWMATQREIIECSKLLDHEKIIGLTWLTLADGEREDAYASIAKILKRDKSSVYRAFVRMVKLEVGFQFSRRPKAVGHLESVKDRNDSWGFGTRVTYVHDTSKEFIVLVDGWPRKGRVALSRVDRSGWFYSCPVENRYDLQLVEGNVPQPVVVPVGIPAGSRWTNARGVKHSRREAKVATVDHSRSIETDGLIGLAWESGAKSRRNLQSFFAEFEPELEWLDAWLGEPCRTQPTEVFESGASSPRPQLRLIQGGAHGTDPDPFNR